MAKYTTTGGTTYDLTDSKASSTTYPGASPKSTPRQGGFTLRNRIDWDDADMPTNALAVLNVANTFRILEVPARVSIRNLRLVKVPGTTNFSLTPTASSYGSVASATLGVGVYFKKNASGSYGTADPDALADHALTNSTAAIPSTMFSGSASTPQTWDVSQSDTNAPVLPLFSGYGGYITMGIIASTGGSSASSGGVTADGVFEVVADCDYMPE